MRFTIDIEIKGEPPFLLPVNYRRNVIALIKELMKSCDFSQHEYNSYWGDSNNNIAKPYTFFLYIPDAKHIFIDGKKFLRLNFPLIKLYVSTNDPRFISILYNGFLKIRKSFFMFDYPIELKEFFISKVKSIDSDSAEFKILSPVLVRNISLEGHRKNFKGYLSCYNSFFNESLIQSIITLCRHFLSYKPDSDEIGIDISGCRIVRIPHYHELVPATKGIIGIKARKDILELIYNIGLGARRSQGFGMVDLAKEAKDVCSNSDLVANELATG